MDDDNVPAELSSGRSHFPAGSLQASPAIAAACISTQFNSSLLMLSLCFMDAVSAGYTHMRMRSNF